MHHEDAGESETFQEEEEEPAIIEQVSHESAVAQSEPAFGESGELHGRHQAVYRSKIKRIHICFQNITPAFNCR